MPELEYKIEAHSQGQRPHTIITHDRGRAIRYVAGLSSMVGYSRVTVTVGGRVYEADQVRGELP